MPFTSVLYSAALWQEVSSTHVDLWWSPDPESEVVYCDKHRPRWNCFHETFTFYRSWDSFCDYLELLKPRRWTRTDGLSWRESGNSFSRHVEHVIQHPGCRVCSPLQAPWNSCLIDWFVLFVSLSVCLLSNLNSGLISYCFSFLFPPCIVLMVYLSVCLSCACLISMFEKVKD